MDVDAFEPVDGPRHEDNGPSERGHGHKTFHHSPKSQDPRLPVRSIRVEPLDLAELIPLPLDGLAEAVPFRLIRLVCRRAARHGRRRVRGRRA